MECSLVTPAEHGSSVPSVVAEHEDEHAQAPCPSATSRGAAMLDGVVAVTPQQVPSPPPPRWTPLAVATTTELPSAEPPPPRRTA